MSGDTFHVPFAQVQHPMPSLGQIGPLSQPSGTTPAGSPATERSSIQVRSLNVFFECHLDFVSFVIWFAFTLATTRSYIIDNYRQSDVLRPKLTSHFGSLVIFVASNGIYLDYFIIISDYIGIIHINLIYYDSEIRMIHHQ